MTAASTLIVAVGGLLTLSWFSSSPESSDRTTAVRRWSRALGHLLIWLLIVGGLTGGAVLIVYAVDFADDIAYGGAVGLFGVVLIAITVAFGIVVRGWLRP